MSESRSPDSDRSLASDQIDAGRTASTSWLSFLPGIEHQILLLRWLALLLVLILHFFDRSSAGVLFSLPKMALVVVGYNGLLLLLMRYVPWLRRPLNYLAVDTVMATLAVYLTGGYHSSFFVLYVFIAIGASFCLELVPTVIVTLGVGLIYVGACYVNPAGLESPYALYILAAKLLLLLVVAVLCALLLEQLRREHRKTEQERALASRLRALNELFQQLNTTLDLELTLQVVADAPRTLLQADMTGIALLEEDGQHLSVVAAAGIDVTLFDGRRWSVDNTFVSEILTAAQPYAVDDPAPYLNMLPNFQVDMSVSPSSVYIIPLLLEGNPLGVLTVAYVEPRTLSEEDMVFLSALSQEAALAIRNARLYKWEREQVARLRALDELRDSFLSAVSHELRTPLTCMRTSVDLLQATSGGFSSDQVDMIGTIEHHLGRLEALVSDLLQSTHLEAGQVTLSKQPTDLRRLVNRVVEGLHPLIERKGHVIHLHLPRQVDLVPVDRRRIEQVLTNMLSNAIKFTPKGGRIEIAVEETGEGVRVSIADNGPGISDKDADHVFEKFYVVTDGRGLSGLGLGLFISKQLVELHGGRICLESRLGRGSTFWFELPKVAQEWEA